MNSYQNSNRGLQEQVDYLKSDEVKALRDEVKELLQWREEMAVKLKAAGLKDVEW